MSDKESMERHWWSEHNGQTSEESKRDNCIESIHLREFDKRFFSPSSIHLARRDLWNSINRPSLRFPSMGELDSTGEIIQWCGRRTRLKDKTTITFFMHTIRATMIDCKDRFLLFLRRFILICAHCQWRSSKWFRRNRTFTLRLDREISSLHFFGSVNVSPTLSRFKQYSGNYRWIASMVRVDRFPSARLHEREKRDLTDDRWLWASWFSSKRTGIHAKWLTSDLIGTHRHFLITLLKQSTFYDEEREEFVMNQKSSLNVEDQTRTKHWTLIQSSSERWDSALVLFRRKSSIKRFVDMNVSLQTFSQYLNLSDNRRKRNMNEPV